MSFNIEDAYNFNLKDDIYPLNNFKKFNKLSIISLEQFIEIYNPNMKTFSLKELVSKLGVNCTEYINNIEDIQVSPGHIEDKISNHFMFKKYKDAKYKKDFSSIYANKTDGIIIPEEVRKYNIYFAIDEREISSYASSETKEKMRRINSKRRRHLKKRYTYTNPLNRIHGLLITEDNACLCTENDEKFYKIVVLCSNPFGSKNGIKAIGSYLLMFSMIEAHLKDYDRLILEVTNNDAEIEKFSFDEDSSSDDEEEDEEENEEIDNTCCDIFISDNVKCYNNFSKRIKDKIKNDRIVDPFDINDREEFLKNKTVKQLNELKNCYGINGSNYKQMVWTKFWT